MVAGIIQGLVTVNHPSYRPEPWHATLITVAVIFWVIVFNFFLATRIPLTEGIILLLHFLAWVTIIVPLWVMAPRAPASVALLHFTNNGNWSTTGLSASIGSFTTLNVLIVSGTIENLSACESDLLTCADRVMTPPFIWVRRDGVPQAWPVQLTAVYSGRGQERFARLAASHHVVDRAECLPRTGDDHHLSFYRWRCGGSPLFKNRRTLHSDLPQRNTKPRLCDDYDLSCCGHPVRVLLQRSSYCQ